MSISLTVKQYNRYPPLSAVLSDVNGPINLTAASQVSLVMKGTTAPSPAIVTGAMSVASAVGGNVTYAWAANDLSVADTYDVEFAIFWASGGLEIVPSNAYDQIVVMASLDGSVGEMPITFFELPQGTPSVTDVSYGYGYATPSDVASLNKSRAQGWGVGANPTVIDVQGYIMMVAGQIDAALVSKGYSVPVNTASNPQVEGLLCYVNSQGAAYMVEEASPSAPNIDRVKAAFDAAMKMLATAEFVLDVPMDTARAEPRGPWVTYTPPDHVFDPAEREGGGYAGDGISGCGGNARSLPFFNRGMRF